MALGLSILFMGVYGFCNSFTATREGVGAIRFYWENWIPFIPWMTVPYLSIDLFFVGAPFLIRDRSELVRFAGRVGFVVLVAGACYLIFPLTLAVERPSFGGPLGAVWEWFKGMDQPHNLMPSLHMALRTLLAGVYARHTRGLMRWILGAWFSLIGISTLTTYQHHFIDVFTGILLGVVALQFCGARPWVFSGMGNKKVGRLYFGASIILGVCLVAGWPASYLLLWPIFSFAGISLAYAGFLPALLRKEEGLPVFCSWMLYAPLLWGQWVSWLYYRTQSRKWDEVVPRLWLGRHLLESEAKQAVDQGVVAVLDLTAEFGAPESFRRIIYKNIPVQDLTAPTMEQMDQCARFIDAHVGSGVVYVHCKAGYSRSVAAVAAYFLHSGRATSPDQAIGMIRQSRPKVVIRPEIVKALEAFHHATRATQPVG
jgi:membrane-associated phospholipid phosphatase